jgi:hypothetical protein
MTRKMAQTALLTALSVGILALGSVIPTATLGIAALAGLCTGVCVLLSGKRQAALLWLAASILALLLLPDKTLALVFALFFGPYPLIKALAERQKPVWEWAIKIILFLAAFGACVWILARFFTLPKLPISYPTLAVLGVAVFILYDFGLSKLFFYLERRLSKFFG